MGAVNPGACQFYAEVTVDGVPVCGGHAALVTSRTRAESGRVAVRDTGMCRYYDPPVAAESGRSQWMRWRSRWGDGLVIEGSAVTFTGELRDGTPVARTMDGHEWILAPRGRMPYYTTMWIELRFIPSFTALAAVMGVAS